MIFYFVVAHSDLWLLNGHNNDQRLASTTAYMCLLAVQALTLYIESHTLTWINHVAILGPNNVMINKPKKIGELSV